MPINAKQVRVHSGPRALVVLLGGLAVLCMAGCEFTSSDPPKFDFQELNFTDTLRVALQSQQVRIVLEQLPDGPSDGYGDVPYEVTASSSSADSMALILDVEGLQGTTAPTAQAYSSTTWTRDTLRVWYEDTPRDDIIRESGKSSPMAKTSPKQPYLRVRRVRLRVPETVDVLGFSNRLVR